MFKVVLKVNKTVGTIRLLSSRVQSGQESRLLRDETATVRLEKKEINNEKTSKPRKQFIVPPLLPKKINTVYSTVGVHLAPTGISWAKLTRESNSLTEWDVAEFTAFPKRSLPIDIYPLITSACDKIPYGDIYVLESPENTNHLGQKPAVLTFQIQQLTLSSMLIPLLNMKSCEENDKEVNSKENKVYYLKSRLSARLFGLLVGNERVSTTGVIKNILESPATQFPFHCTPVDIGQSLIQNYYDRSPVDKELLGQSLLLAITFMDLCIYKNDKSITEVTRIRR